MADPVTLAALARSGGLGATVPPMAETPPAVTLAELARAGLLSGPLDYSSGRPSPLAVLSSMPREERTAPLEGPPTSPPPMLPTLSGVENQPSHHSAYQPREAGRFTGPPSYPRDQRPRNDPETAVENAAVGIDYSQPLQLPPAVGGFMNESVSSANDQPISRWLEQRGIRPIINDAERGARTAVNMAGEMTGIRAAQRSGQALAEGDIGRGVGNALMALPSRLATLPGFLLSGPAEAQAPDTRRTSIQEIDKDIKDREARIQRYTTQTFRGRTSAERDSARQLAIETEKDAIKTARERRQRIQDSIDADETAVRQREEAAQRGAEWRNTPTNRAYPGVGYGTTALGFGLAAYLPYRGARGPTLAYNQTVTDLNNRWQTAIARANDNNLTLAQRRQAAQVAMSLRTQFQAATANVPGGPTGWDRLRTAGISGLTADAGIMAPDLFDYIYSLQDPEGQLHSTSMSQLNPFNNPGRLTAGFMGGAAAGGVGEELGTRFPRVATPTGFDAETDALLKRYPSLAPQQGRRRRR